MKKIIITSLMILLLGGAVFSENVINLDKAELKWSLDGEYLTVSMSAETQGWISVGLGSKRMDGAVMFFSFVKDDTVYFEEHLGKGHRHNKTDVQRQVEYEVTESDGVTEMTFTISKNDFIKAGQTELPVIVAWGKRDSFSSIHKYRDAATLIFQ